MPRLESISQKGQALIQKGMEYLFCNKATAFYWTKSAQMRGDCGPLILGSIWSSGKNGGVFLTGNHE
jgi:hypothetical protein